MPTSNLAIWPALLWLVQEVEHRRVLDVGPGHGKASVLLREYLNDPPTEIDAVELHSPYIDAFDIRPLYREVLECDVCALDDGRLAMYDVILMADVIEHIDKDTAVALLSRIPCRVVISTPVEFFSNGPGLPASETHRSHWTAEDFLATGRVESCQEIIGGWIVRLGPR